MQRTGLLFWPEPLRTGIQGEPWGLPEQVNRAPGALCRAGDTKSVILEGTYHEKSSCLDGSKSLLGNDNLRR